MSASQTSKSKKSRASKAKVRVPRVPIQKRAPVKPIPLRESNRNAALIPTRIKQRMADLIAILGHRELFALFDERSHIGITLMERGAVPPTWAAWHAFQIIEREAFRTVRRLRRKLCKPRLLAADESIRVTPMTDDEIDEMRAVEDRDCGFANCGCQHVPDVLPANVVRLRRTA